MDFQNLPCDIKNHIFNFNRIENNKQLLANKKKYDEVVKQWKNVIWLSYECNCVTPHPEDPTFQEFLADDFARSFWDDQASGHNSTPEKTFIHKDGLEIYDWSREDDDRTWFNLNKLP